jgi:hypothetical protein
MILILFIICVFWFKKVFKKDFSLIIFPLIVGFIIVISYRLELLYINRLVYFSDAQYYYDLSLQDDFTFFSYVSFLKLINYLHFFNYPVEINITNFLLFLISCTTLLKIVQLNHEKTSHTIKKRVVFLIMCNPFLIISLSRNLKDCFFLFLITFFIYAFQNFKKKYIFQFFLCIIFSLILKQVRPWAILFPFLLFVFNLLITSPGFIKKLIIIFLLIAISLFSLSYINSYLDYISIWFEITKDGINEGEFSLSLSERLKGPLKILVSPGIPRLLFPELYFKYSMATVSLYLLIGILINYVILSNIQIKKILKEFFQNFNLFLLFIIPLLIYSFAYSGSVEFRIKAIILIPLFFLIISSIDNYPSLLRKSNLPYLIFIIFVSTLFSL